MKRVLLIILLLLTPLSRTFASDGVPFSIAAFEVQNPDLTNISEVLTTAHFNLRHDIHPEQAKTVAYLMEFSCHTFLAIHNMLGFELHEPADKLNWICFNEADAFDSYTLVADKMDLTWLSGYYSAGTNAVAFIKPRVMPEWEVFKKLAASPPGENNSEYSTPLVEIVHESAHQLAFNTGLQKRGVMYPLWAGEGPALFFEDSLSHCVPSPMYSKLRMETLAELGQQNSLIPLRQFVTLSRLPADAAQADIYAQAFGFYSFLFENHTGELKQYFKSLYALKPGARAEKTMLNEFTNAFGPLELLEKQWAIYLLSRVDQP